MIEAEQTRRAAHVNVPGPRVIVRSSAAWSSPAATRRSALLAATPSPSTTTPAAATALAAAATTPATGAAASTTTEEWNSIRSSVTGQLYQSITRFAVIENLIGTNQVFNAVCLTPTECFAVYI